MKKRALFLFLCILTCLFYMEEPTKKTADPSKKLSVLCTTLMIGDLAKSVGGDLVNISILIHSGLDPHSYQLVKGDAERFSNADLVFYHGLGLEHGGSLVKFLQSKSCIDLGKSVQNRVAENILETNGIVDPHIWMDVRLWAEATHAIEEAFSKRQPEHAQIFRENAQNIRRKMAGFHQYLLGILQDIPKEKRYVITSHDSFSYFARTYLREPGEDSWQRRFQAPAGLSPEGQLSFHDIEKIVAHAKEFSITTIFPEANISTDALRKIIQCGRAQGLQEIKIAEESLYGDTMGPYNYFEMMEHNAKTLRKYLQ